VRTRILATTLATPGFTSGLVPQARASVNPIIGPVITVSQGCAGQNAEVQTAVDPLRGDVYEEWMGCDGIGFARSTDGGRHFDAPLTVPGSAGGWDPALALARNGTLVLK
jgi:hypothetical protein